MKEKKRKEKQNERKYMKMSPQVRKSKFHQEKMKLHENLLQDFL